jgi:hypothetical protein
MGGLLDAFGHREEENAALDTRDLHLGVDQVSLQ